MDCWGAMDPGFYVVIDKTMKALMKASVKLIVVLGFALMVGCTVVPGAYHSPTPGWFIDDDEIVEVTPLNIRIRKRYLKEHERKKASRGT